MRFRLTRGCHVMHVCATLEAKIILKSRWKDEYEHARDTGSGIFKSGFIEGL